MPRWQQWAAEGNLQTLFPYPWNVPFGFNTPFNFAAVTGLKASESLDRWRSFSSAVSVPPLDNPSGPKRRKKLVPQNQVWLTSLLPENESPSTFEAKILQSNPSATQDDIANKIPNWQASPIWNWKPEEDWKFFSQWVLPQINAWNETLKEVSQCK